MLFTSDIESAIESEDVDNPQFENSGWKTEIGWFDNSRPNEAFIVYSATGSLPTSTIYVGDQIAFSHDSTKFFRVTSIFVTEETELQLSIYVGSLSSQELNDLIPPSNTDILIEKNRQFENSGWKVERENFISSNTAIIVYSAIGSLPTSNIQVDDRIAFSNDSTKFFHVTSISGNEETELQLSIYVGSLSQQELNDFWLVGNTDILLEKKVG